MAHRLLYWEDKNKTIEESKKYSSRVSFSKGSYGAYRVAKKNGWLDEMTWLNRRNVYRDLVDCVYKYHFVNENSVYIGRTIYPELRDRQHRTREKDTVNRFSKDNNTEIPKMEIIEEGLTVLQGAEREKYWAKYYKNKGVKLINKQPCGSLGLMCNGKWSKRKCFEEAKKYKLRSEFQKNASQAYHISMQNGWIEEMTWFPKNREHPNGYWRNKENFLKEARKYNTKKELEKGNLAAYNAGWKYGYFDDVTWFKNGRKNRKHKGYWSKKENVIEESKRFNNRTEFKRKSGNAYNSAVKNKWINEMPWLDQNNNKLPKGYWKNRENMMAEAKKYKTKEEFQKGNLTAFLAAHKYGYIDEMWWLVKQKQHKKGYWTYKHIEEEALKYSTKTEFFKGNQTAYRAALKLGIIDDFFMLNDYVE